MKKIFLFIALGISFGCKSQTILTNKIPEYRFENKLSAGIQNSTANPTDVWFQVGDSATTKAMFIPRVQTTAAITNPRQGMVVYSISDSSFYYRSLFGWRKGITTSSVINDLADVNITSPSSGHYLTYLTNEWVNQAPNKADTIYRTSAKDSIQFTIDGRYHAIKDSVGAYTASNGLTLSASDFKLGGTLTGNTTINTAGFTTTLTGVNTADVLDVTATSGSGVAIKGTGLTGRGVYGVTNDGFALYGLANTSGYGLFGTSASGVGVYGKSISSLAGQFQVQPSSTNTVVSVAEVDRLTSGTASDGIGGSFDFYNNSNAGLIRLSNQLISKLTTAADAARTSQFIITGVANAVTADLFTLSGSGATKLNKYGNGLFTGTPVYSLQTDASGNIIEGALGVTTMTAIGSSPNANGATISGANLTLQPANATYGGVLTSTTQDIAGFKEFQSGIRLRGSTPNLYVGVATTGTGANVPTIFSYSANGTYKYSQYVDNAAGDYQFVDNSANIRLGLAQDGRLYGTAIHNNAGSVTGTTNQYIASGTWTPTLTNVTNVAASTAYEGQWTRVGNVVTVSGKVDIDVTGAGATELGMSLPIASAMTVEQNLGGSAVSAAAAALSAAIRADATNDRAAIVFTATSLTNDSYFFTFTYVVK